MERKGILFVLSGPSGAGKGTVLHEVLQRVSGLAVSVSVTTRAARPGEIDGIHYHFRTQEQFQAMVENNEFLEYVSKFNNRYGTPKAQVQKLLEEGTDVVLEIETKGAAKIRKNNPDAVYIFITPSSFEELTRRLSVRGTESPEVCALRLKIARTEYRSIRHYDYIAINDNLQECVDAVCAIILAERNRRKRNPSLAERLMNPCSKC
jgi:guanylate kinase